MSVPIPNIPKEFDLRAAHGFTMRGWDFSSIEVGEAIRGYRMLNPAMELGTNICPWNCDFCFTESPNNPDDRKHRLQDELSIERRLHLIDEAAELGCKSINFVGAGEPTIDPDFWQLLERMQQRGITPIVYTEGSLKLKSRSFAQKLFDLGATVVLKVNSLNNAEYQDRVLRGIRSKVGIPPGSYTADRQKALDSMMDIGFNFPVPTRLAFDCIICRENADEIEAIHRFARLNNIFVLFVNYLPSGRTTDGHTSAISWEEQHNIFKRLAEIDETEFGLKHATHFPYSGCVPCTIRGLGLFVTIRGGAFDCPGESIQLGNVKEETLATVWQKARSITENFDGGCFPRQQFWKRLAAAGGAKSHS
jgi:MoaA/NifB/PqqE/SkfB family radical SAM enzyme